MTPRVLLVLMTVVAVVTDSALHPFYPQYFAEVFGVHDALHVGLYIGACSLTVLTSFPLWARLAKRFDALKLLLLTQLVTAVCSLASAATTSLAAFWAVSLLMMVFKASYLLIYPYCMSLEAKEQHIGTISLLALVVYFGNILAAALSGLLFELYSPRFLFIAMACGDLVQTLLCIALLRQPRGVETASRQTDAGLERTDASAAASRGFVLRLGAVMFVLYFSAYVTEPFFSSYWEELAAEDSRIVSGLVFAIPGVAALLGLVRNAVRAKRQRTQPSPYAGITAAIAAAIAALLLQLGSAPWLLIAGRFAYGWALFQCMVRLDLLLFHQSERADYSVDFSKINLFQGLGVLLASFVAGSLVSAFGIRVPFGVAALGFALGALVYLGLFRKELKTALAATADGAARGVGVAT